eukprot:Sspe_Gene.29940::Locus_14485_Transcript_2_2_Confidence_0.800_Length_942::g.29940::m.29940
MLHHTVQECEEKEKREVGGIPRKLFEKSLGLGGGGGSISLSIYLFPTPPHQPPLFLPSVTGLFIIPSHPHGTHGAVPSSAIVVSVCDKHVTVCSSKPCTSRTSVLPPAQHP